QHLVMVVYTDCKRAIVRSSWGINAGPLAVLREQKAVASDPAERGPLTHEVPSSIHIKRKGVIRAGEIELFKTTILQNEPMKMSITADEVTDDDFCVRHPIDLCKACTGIVDRINHAVLQHITVPS